MKKKTIILVICVLSLLLLTSWSYGGPDPRHARFLAHPWEHLLSPKAAYNQNIDLIVLVINPHFYLMLRSQTKLGDLSDLDKSPNEKSATSITRGSLNKNETGSKK
ncbi:MAG: hypothetical protein WCE90_04785 [Candidatus Zixiibacteriota bacterium]